MARKLEKIAPDTSVLVDGMLSKMILSGELTPHQVLIHEAAVAELEHQANENKATGFLGIDELERLRQIAPDKGFELHFTGKKPHASELKYAKLGEIDSLIRDMAYENEATLITADKIQARVAQAKNMQVVLIELEDVVKKLQLDSFFDKTTMSVHLRESVPPFAKKGAPGNWQFVKIRPKVLSREEVQDISREIIEEAAIRKDGFVEIERPGSTIVQLGSYRIVITKPPFSDGWEITAVRPVRRMSLADYKLTEKLSKRIDEHAEGILIAGAPGMGKSTFAQALGEHYASQDKIVKTIEAPRDLVLPESITQYAISHGDAQEIHDILLLSRPDYTLFDEMRNTDDFRLFADLRLAGIGLAGVVHATNPIDAIQRFVGRIELGVIPQIVDTVIFIQNGNVGKVLSLQMVVKVPAGMTEADLARPVVVVTDFETKKPEYELYSYGEETVVVPVRDSNHSPGKALAAKSVENELRRYVPNVKAEVLSDHKCVVYVPKKDIAKIIGRGGSTINEIEKHLGMNIDVKEVSEKQMKEKKELSFDSKISKRGVEFYLDEQYTGQNVDIAVDGDYLLSANVGKRGIIKVKRGNKIGRIISNAINSGEKVKILLAD